MSTSHVHIVQEISNINDINLNSYFLIRKYNCTWHIAQVKKKEEKVDYKCVTLIR